MTNRINLKLQADNIEPVLGLLKSRLELKSLITFSIFVCFARMEDHALFFVFALFC